MPYRPFTERQIAVLQDGIQEIFAAPLPAAYPLVRKDAMRIENTKYLHTFSADEPIVAMTIHQDRLYVATARGVYRLAEKDGEEIFERMMFVETETREDDD